METGPVELRVMIRHVRTRMSHQFFDDERIYVLLDQTSVECAPGRVNRHIRNADLVTLSSAFPRDLAGLVIPKSITPSR